MLLASSFTLFRKRLFCLADFLNGNAMQGYCKSYQVTQFW